MQADPKMSTWEDAVVWLRAQPDRQQLVLDAFYDDPLITYRRGALLRKPRVGGGF